MAGNRQTLSADGSTNFVRVVGPVHLSLTGTFGSGTATFEALDPGGNAVAIANGAFTAITDTLFDFPPAAINDVRITIASSSSPSLVIWVQGADPRVTGV